MTAPKTPLRSKLDLPDFEKTPDEIRTRLKEGLSEARTRLKELGNKASSKGDLSFDDILGALDQLQFDIGHKHSRIYFILNTHPSAPMREAAQEAHQEWQKFSVEMTYDENLYRTVKKYEAQSPKLMGEQKKFFDEILRNYRRMGFELPHAQREEVKKLLQRLHEVEASFSKNIQEYRDELEVDEKDLQGLDAAFVQNLRRSPAGKFLIGLDYPEYLPVMEFAQSEDLRRRLLEKKYRTAHATNRPHLNEMVQLRSQIAKKLGYASWNHFVMEERMAKSPERVHQFLQELETNLRKRSAKDVEELTKLKRAATKDPQAELKIWDYYYYQSLLKRKKHQVDEMEIRNYFPLSQVLEGMFALYRELFGIRMMEQDPSQFHQWHPEVRLFKVVEEDGTGIGYFYLDLHPREGKYNHAAAFGITDGKKISETEYQGPVRAMVCNFPRAQGGEPALIHHRDVDTLFHEFGHILHGLLTKAEYAFFSGTSVAWDFVEAPSQIMENWCWHYESLARFARDWRKPSETIPESLVEKMVAAKKDGITLHYLRQLSLAKADLQIHGPEVPRDAVETANLVLQEVFLAPPEGSCFAAGWGHMVGYAGGYYGYAWADVMAADLFSLFKAQGIMNSQLGRKLRREIFEPGGSRDENISLEAFLGRPLSSKAFFEDLSPSSR